MIKSISIFRQGRRNWAAHVTREVVSPTTKLANFEVEIIERDTLIAVVVRLAALVEQDSRLSRKRSE